MAPKRHFTGRVDDQAVLHLQNRPAWTWHLSTLKGKPVDFWVEEQQETRSDRANRYLWGVVYRAISKDTEQDKESVHEAMKQRFLGDSSVVFVNPQTGEVEERRVVGSSRKLKVHEFYLFVENVRLFASEWLGLVIPDPEPGLLMVKREKAA